MTTLCVAAWTPDGGLIVAQMGDTLPILVCWPDPERAAGGLLGLPHRNPFGGLQSCLGADVPCTSPDLGGAEFSLVTVEDDDGEWAFAVARDSDFEELIPAPSAGEWTVVVASDGVWEKLLPDPTKPTSMASTTSPPGSSRSAAPPAALLSASPRVCSPRPAAGASTTTPPSPSPT